MTELSLSIAEPMSSPAWGSNFVVFMPQTGLPVGESLAKEYLRRCCKYARHYEVWVVPERFVMMGYQCMSLISPEGKVLGAQKGLYSGPSYKSTGKKSTGIEIFPSEFGSIFLCVDVDIFQPEALRVATAMGAEIIISSQSIAGSDYGSHMIITGPWNIAQLTGVFVIASSNQYNAVCAPIGLTPKGDGFLNTPGLKIPMTQKFSVKDLSAIPKPKPLNRKLYALHREELIG
jgi:hypothetical protein